MTDNNFLGIGMMRFGVLLALILGSIVILSGVVGFFFENNDAAAIIGCGSGMISLALGSKAWQAQSEKQAETKQNGKTILE